MKILCLSNLSKREREGLFNRGPFRDVNSIRVCEDIFDQIKKGGNQAVRHFTKTFDGLDLESTLVSSQEFEKALEDVENEENEALQQALENIEIFHLRQCTQEYPKEVQPGICCWREQRPINPVGLYVPAGSAPLASTLLMLGVPARIAGCSDISICVPPRQDGSVDSYVLSAARLLKIDSVHKIGGAQAIAALALGTETIPAVAKIVGPGSKIVQSAKALAVQYGTAIDLLAGPSEILVVSDGSTNSKWIAADLISQAEHGRDSRCVLVTTSSEHADQVSVEISKQLEGLPRGELARESLNSSFILVVTSLQDAIEFSNKFAPEHLVLQVLNPMRWGELVESAGSVFLGPYSPVVAGDYASGTNHTLPTSGTAAGYSGVSVETFVRKISFQNLTQNGLQTLSPTLRTLARIEGLEGHARAVEFRLDKASLDISSTKVHQLHRRRKKTIELDDLPTYQAARLAGGEGLLLDANENPFDTEYFGVSLNRYPDPRQLELRREISRYLGCSPNMILAGCGSDEVLDWLIRASCRCRGDMVAVAQPTYSMYEILAVSHGIGVVHLSLDDKFDFQAKDFLQRVTSCIKLLFLCSPNNPTGNLLNSSQIEMVCGSWDGIVAVDEAYIEFADQPSLVNRIKDLPNLAVVRTLSKAWGRASLRVGYLVANRYIIKGLERIKFPYNLGGLTMKLAIDCLHEKKSLEEKTRVILKERQRVGDELKRMEGILKVFPSKANFVLFRCEKATEICSRLRDKKIIVRDRGDLHKLSSTIRVTIGSPEQNSRFLSELKEVLYETAH